LFLSGLLLFAAPSGAAWAQPAPDDPGAPAPQASAFAGQMIPVYPGTLLPQTAVSLALARHPEIKGAEAVIARRQADAALARSERWPTIQYGIGPGYGGSYGGGGNQSAIRASLGIEQPLWDFGATRNRIAAAADLEAAAHASKADTAEKVAQSTLAAYAETTAAQERLAAAGDAIQSMRQVRERIRLRVEAGLSNRSDLNAASVAVRRAELDAEGERTRADAAMSRLIELIGVSARHLAALQDSYALIAMRRPAEPDFEQAPAIQAAGHALDAAAAKEEIARAELLPAINLNASRSFSTGNYSANDATWVGLLLKGSFSLGGAGRERVAAAVADREATRQELESRRLQARTEWQVAMREEQGARRRMSDFEEVASLWQTTRELYWGEYILDKRSLGDVINAEREIYTARAERVTALADALMATMKARVAQGQLVALLDEEQ
jgi:adhesin transport system outer membrane protein